MLTPILSTNVRNLYELERFELIRSVKPCENTTDYLNSILQNLSIELLGKSSRPFLEMTKEKLLSGWTWQTTETAILFFDNFSYVQRGYLSLSDRYTTYPNSWIKFNYMNTNYIYDPGFNLLVEEEIYFHIFEVTLLSEIKAENIKKDFYYRVMTLTSDKISPKYYNPDEIYIHGTCDITSPMYKNNTGYKAICFKGEDLQSLSAHYYGNFLE